jgi:NADPH:quinone reductase
VRAAWYERQGPAEDVLSVGDLSEPVPGPGEVRVRVRVSGVNVGDVKKREGWLGFAMPFPRVIPHSDGAGEIDAVGEGVDPARQGERIWCYGAQSHRPFGTAAELVVVPGRQAVPLPESASFGLGACLGIPGLTAHRAVFADGPVEGLNVLVSGAGGTVGTMAAQLAAWGGATVFGIVRDPEDVGRARRAGVEHVFVSDGRVDGIASAILELAPEGIDRIVEVALSSNLEFDTKVLAQGGVITAYASSGPDPRLPFWPLSSSNATVRLLGSDEFPQSVRDDAVRDIVSCLGAGKLDAEIGSWFPLEEIASAHRAVERPSGPGRVVVLLD